MKRVVLSLIALLTPAFGFMALAAAAPAPTPAASAPITAAQTEFFEKSVRPVLAQNCYACHGPGKQEASLRLDSLAAILKGGDSGPALVPGDPVKSRMLQAVQYTGALQMPPAGKLPDQAIAALTQWVKVGAPWPGVAAGPVLAGMDQRIAEMRAKHWSLQPIKDSPLPAVRDKAWVKTPVDRFILAGLEAAGLKPSPPADKLTLIRRVTYDVTGLPPTPAEVVEFVNDNSPKAYEKLVDRLLTSPHYGERWGRHWLDVARYADTLGYLVGDAERRYPWAFTYRDYVVRALNEDKPYNRFVEEQLAADQLQLSDKRNLAALGFLTVGNHFLENREEIIDDRIDVVCRGLQAMTVGCARCHDHKFDPIPSEDYYALHGVFASCNVPGDLPVIGDAPDARAAATYKEKMDADQKELSHLEETMATPDLVNKEKQKIQELVSFDPGAPPRAMVLQDDKSFSNPRVFLRGNPGTPGKEIPRRFLVAVDGETRKPFTHGSGRLDLAEEIISPENPLTARVIVNRVWGFHFGKGLSTTPSDFGIRGELPTNPALLDWLSYQLMQPAVEKRKEEKEASQNAEPPSHGSLLTAHGPLTTEHYACGWSLKKLHRLILLSNTYQESCLVSPAQKKLDPENHLLGHMNRQRLDLEEIRDSILADAGTLDLNIGGRAIDILEAPFSTRRTIYGFMDRQNVPGLYRTFDYPDPSATAAHRAVTTVPQQSLFLMNNPFVQEQAQKLLDRPGIAAQKTPDAKIRQLYRVVYGRSPSASEISMGLAFLKKADAEPADGPSVEAAAWQYGYGEYDSAAHRMKSFTALPRFTGQAWQGGPALPDPKLGWVTLNSNGGHPGNDLQHNAVRRWVAPFDGTVAIHGTVNHPSQQGDGIHAVIVSSRTGLLGEWIAFHSSADTNVERVDVHKGDTIDFSVDCRTNNGFDSFSWAPGLQAVAGGSGQTVWDAAADFSGPSTASTIKPLTAWETYAQALFLTNEFLFLD